MKKLTLLLFLILAIGAGAFIFAYSQRQVILSGKIQKGLESLTGTRVEMKGFHLQNPYALSSRAVLEIATVRIKNPSGFSQRELAEASNVELEIDFLKLIAGRWLIRSLKIPIDHINLEIDSKAQLNLAALTALQKEALEASASPSFWAKKIEFSFGGVYFYDYPTTAQKNPRPEQYHFARRMELYTSVRRPEVLIQAPALQLLYQLNKGSLGLPRGKIQEAITRNTGKSTT